MSKKNRDRDETRDDAIMSATMDFDELMSGAPQEQQDACRRAFNDTIDRLGNASCIDDLAMVLDGIEKHQRAQREQLIDEAKTWKRRVAVLIVDAIKGLQTTIDDLRFAIPVVRMRDDIERDETYP